MPRVGSASQASGAAAIVQSLDTRASPTERTPRRNCTPTPFLLFVVWIHARHHALLGKPDAGPEQAS